MSGSSAPRSWPRAGESIQGGSSALFSLLVILPSVFLLHSPLPFFPWVLLAGGGDASCGLCCRSCPRCSRFAPGPHPLPAAGEGPRRAGLASRSGGATRALLVAALLSAWEQRDQAGRALRLLPLLAAAVCHGLFVHLEERRAIGRGRRGAARAGMAPGAPAPCLRDPGGPSRASLGPAEKKTKQKNPPIFFIQREKSSETPCCLYREAHGSALLEAEPAARSRRPCRVWDRATALGGLSSFRCARFPARETPRRAGWGRG